MAPFRRRGALFGAAALALATSGLAAFPASARTNYALIVGVTEYPLLSRSNWLIGPKNDAIMVRDYLTKQSPVPFDPANVAVLADGVEGAKEPTLAGIVAALDDLAENKVKDGDFVYIQLSGHGFQQTAADASTETDGLDEIFLPKDTGRWVDRSKGMPNVLVDDVVGNALDKIRGKGAFVWVVFDACHSGTATRAAPGDDVVERKVDAAALGMPSEVLTEAPSEGTRDLTQREAPVETGAKSAKPVGTGGMVAFFAAQTNETTPEMPLPPGKEGAQKYGLFTYTIMSTLADNPNVTYRQLAEGVLQHYASINRTSTTPLFEGDLDTQVFSAEPGLYVPQWPIDVADSGVTIPGGAVNGLVPGTKLAIVEKAGSKTADAIGMLEVKSSDNFSSRVAIAREEPGPTAARATVRSIGDIPKGAQARLVKAAYDFSLKVARPAPSAEFPAKVAMVNELLDAIAADQSTQMRVEIVEPGKPADLRLAVFSEASLGDAPLSASADAGLWFLPESGEVSVEEGRRPPSIIMKSDDAKAIGGEIAHYLTRIYRATNLGRISQGSEYGSEDIDVSFTLKRKEGGEQVEITTTNLPVGQPEDRVSVSATNKTGTAVDINILYIGSDFSITHMGRERLQPSATFRKEFLEFTPDSYGRELMVAVFTEARPLTPTLDLRYLAQDGLRSVTRGAEAESIAELIEGMGMGAVTRGAKTIGASEGKPKGSVMLFPVQTVPRS